MTARNARRLHRELWDWLSKNPGGGKSQWPRWMTNGGDVVDAASLCFACQAMIISGRGCEDYGCPLKWPHEPKESRLPCPCTGRYQDGLFQKWLRAYGYDKDRRRLAAKIRDLPWTTPRRLKCVRKG